MAVPLRAVLAAAVLAAPAFPADRHPNILLVIADDVGVYELASYGEGTDCPATPVIDGLAQSGVLFRNCWANPLCSPTRATIQTGRYSVETGMGTLLTGAYGLPLTEVTVAEALELTHAGYSRALFGKWHLSNLSTECGALLAPNLSGYDHAVWTVQNLVPPESYFHWSEVEDGVESVRDGYVTTNMVDRALEWVATAPQPWFVVLSFHAAHDPFHAPPDGLYTTDLSTASQSNPRPYFKAMIESLDHELGRFLTGIGRERAQTEILFVGDNGSPSPVIGPPGLAAKSKGTMYEGGINVPLILAGPSAAAPGTVCDALVNTTDLFATVIELAGASIPPAAYANLELNTVSLVPYLADPTIDTLRAIAYADYFKPSGFSATFYQGAARERRYKLHMGVFPYSFQLYDLKADPFEDVNLLAAPLTPGAQAAYDKLKAAIKAEIASYGN
jgi:arylsulfatase A-like enzyme